MIILGIDPGTASTGYAVIEIDSDNSTRIMDFGCIRTEPETPRQFRLKMVFESINKLLKKHKPDVLAMEQLFFNKNVRTALRVGEAQGVALLSSALAGVEVSEYTPLQVKETLAGYGRASKEEVRRMVMFHLKMKTPPEPDDAADALAIALCHHIRHCLEGVL